MSCILYYSNHCEHSKRLLLLLSKTKLKDDVHFISIDNREKGRSGEINIILPNGQKILLPSQVIKVPALLLINHGRRVLFSEEIYEYFKPKMDYINDKATSHNKDPLAFSIYEMGTSLSDCYSYLDLTSEDLSAKGNGGLRMLHHFVTLKEKSSIETPPEDYTPNTIKNLDMGQLQQQREQDIRLKK